ncbi:MAG TPA: type I-E CRISPR-associated protein Cas7/Cse4/CasC [Alphaproteobacteria bacterium]|nr:type I-E CRISPR-associated protein Cas7/Cse4/CasC [Alphaproteobacteria bacterium]
MTTFLQLHLLTAYGPSNLNRDDTGRPKTAVFGGAERLRISSQSLKRAWRTSDPFREACGEFVGERSQRFAAEYLLKSLLTKGVKEKEALARVRSVLAEIGKPKDEKDERSADIEQLAHLGPEEIARLTALADALSEGKLDEAKEKLILVKHPKAVDIAMFGRMLADNPDYNVEAAVQVAHAITTHKAIVEDDYFTAVDDLKRHEDDRGAGMIGVQEYGSGLFYTYICVDKDLLLKNLSGDAALTNKAIEGLVRAATTIAPGGKQNSFGSRARATFVLAEKGSDQPRSLAVAFLNPVTGEDLLIDSIGRLTDTRTKIDTVYGDERRIETMNARTGEGSLDAVIRLLTE